MKEFVYCPTLKRAIDAPPPDISGSCNSSIASSDSANYIDECLSNFRVLNLLDPKVLSSFSFDLQYQVTPHIATDGRGILGNLEGDAATINSECSVATKATTMSYLKPPINYLVPPPVPPSENATSASQTTAPATSAKDLSLTAAAALCNRPEEFNNEYEPS